MPLGRVARPGTSPDSLAGRRAVRLRTRPFAGSQGLVVFLAVGCGYLALSQLTLWVNAPTVNWAGLWPGAGLSLAALLLLPRRMWGWVLAAVFLAELFSDALAGLPFLAGVGWGLANSVEPLVAALLLTRLGNPHGDLSPARKLLGFLLAGVLVGPLVGSFLGTSATVLGLGGSFAVVWPKYFVGDALGVLVVTPALLAFRLPAIRRSTPETLWLLLTGGVVTAAVFAGPYGAWTVTMPYLLLPVLGWAGLRFGVRGTAWLAVVITLTANYATAVDAGPFARAGGPPGQAVTLLQVFLAIAVSFALLLAALTSDLRGREQLESALRFQATHDSLTGLANRGSLNAALEQALAGADPGGQSVGLLVCDIDHFKQVNDRVGHQGGDLLLVEVASRLRASVRPGDLVARISGDEFVVLLQGVDPAALDSVARRIVATMSMPVALGPHREVTPSVSVGATLATAGEGPESVFQAADSALFDAKRQGRGRIVHVDDQLRGRTHDQNRIETDLVRGLDEQEFTCVFEPGIDVVTGRVTGFEALARWNHPTRGIMPPELFLSAVEATGNADRLFATVLERTLAAQTTWAEARGYRHPVAVNLSTVQLADSRAIERIVADALERTGAPVETLWIDVTERAPLDAVAQHTLRALRRMGVHLALDGFGGPGSSFHTLRSSEWDLLKLDRTYVEHLQDGRGAADMLRATVAMARSLGIGTLALGVDTAARLEQVRDLGCDVAQGRFFGAPATAGEVDALIDRDGGWAPEPRVPDQERPERRRQKKPLTEV